MLTEQTTFEAAFESGIGLIRNGEIHGDLYLMSMGIVILDELVTEQPDAYMNMLRERMPRLGGMLVPQPEL